MDEKLVKRRAVITAITLGAAAIISILCLLYAVTQTGKLQHENEVLKKENESLRNKLK